MHVRAAMMGSIDLAQWRKIKIRLRGTRRIRS
jgi:hypothetical protein